MEFVKNYKDDLINKVYVYIEDCPLGIREELQNYRNNYINDLKKETNSLKYKIKTFIKRLK